MVDTDKIEEYMSGTLWLESDSQAVAAIHYDPQTRHLYARMAKSGKVIVYLEVSEDVARGFAQARSQGKYHWDHFRLTPEQKQAGEPEPYEWFVA